MITIYNYNQEFHLAVLTVDKTPTEFPYRV